jgi:uncharacterized protein (DUF305 family)
MMVPHHMMAIEMARLELSNGSHAELEQAARKIITAQQAEIAQMKALRKRLYRSASAPTAMSTHEMENMGMTMPAQMAGMRPFDKLFIDQMIPHHAGAITMARVALMHSKNATIRRLAQAIYVDQSREIGELIGWRLRWYGRGI